MTDWKRINELRQLVGKLYDPRYSAADEWCTNFLGNADVPEDEESIVRDWANKLESEYLDGASCSQ